jgi:hypothetical protein
MTKILTILFLLLSFNVLAQSEEEYWANWNKNYPKTDIVTILDYEKYYADSIEKNPEIPPYYSRLDKYKFQAVYLGKTRALNMEVLNSMKHVFKLFIGDANKLDGMCEKEVLFKVGNQEIWMPIQTQILKALKNEARVGDNINLYCLFLNEHNSQNKLYNTFLISEFHKL